jgi:succinate-acetate transporter protein
MDGANVQTGGKNRSNTFVLTAFISFGLFNVFHINYKVIEMWVRHVNALPLDFC